MSVKEYEVDGKKLWFIYINQRSSLNPSVRLQKRVFGFESHVAAAREERKLISELAKEIGKLEAQGCSWSDLIDKWECYHKLYPSSRYATTTLHDHSQLLRNWTKPWLDRNPSEITRGDAREIFNYADSEGKSVKFCTKLKHTINVIYNWGIEERLVVGQHQSPVKGVEISGKQEEKMPEILSVEQVQVLLREAKARLHPWYAVWALTVLTGCRSGEVHGLRKEDLQLIHPDEVKDQLNLPPERRHYGLIRLQRSWNAKLNKYGPLKARYWRNVPISGELYNLIQGLIQTDFGSDELGSYLLPRFWEWDCGNQAEVLRQFCREINIPSIRFHTLRACFATHLISKGVPSTTVMKICGWKELKTMERYIRLAGIDERGATEGLGFIPTEQGVMENVVNMFQFRGQT